MVKYGIYSRVRISKSRLEKTAVLDKLRTEIERQQSAHDGRDSSSEDENGGRSCFRDLH